MRMDKMMGWKISKAKRERGGKDANTGYEAHAMGVHESQMQLQRTTHEGYGNKAPPSLLVVEQPKPESRAAAGSCTQGRWIGKQSWDSYSTLPSPSARGGQWEQDGSEIFRQNHPSLRTVLLSPILAHLPVGVGGPGCLGPFKTVLCPLGNKPK